MPAGTPLFVVSGYPHRCGAAAQSVGVAGDEGEADPAGEDDAAAAPWEDRGDGEAGDGDGDGDEARDEGLLTSRPAVELPGVMPGEQEHPAGHEDGHGDRAARPDRGHGRAAPGAPRLPVPRHVRCPLTGALTSARLPPGPAARR